MKKFVTLILSIFCFGSRYFAVTTYTWTGATNSDFFTASNWNPSTGTPGSGDDAVFNSGSVACNITAGITVKSFSLLSGYTGIVDMGTASHLITGNLVVNSGTLISTTAILEIDLNSGTGDFVLGAGGVFTHNGGSLDLYSNAGTTFQFSGGIILNTLNLNTLGGTVTSRIIDFGSNLSVNDIILNGTGSKVFDFQGNIHVKNSLDLGNSSHNAINASNNGTFIFDGTGASIIGSTSTGAGKAYLPNIQINTTGTYSITATLNVLGNWTCSQGTLNIGSSTVNMYGTSASISGTAAAFDNITVQSGATVNMPSNAEVKVGGALTNSGGTLNFQTTTALGLNAPGSTSQSLAGGFTLAGLKAYGTGSSRNVTITGSMINILDSLKLGDHITFNTNGFITLKSSNALTARVAEIPSSSSVSGNVTVETFIPGGTTGWANLGIRGVTGQTFADWDTYVSSGATTGIPMSCTGCVYSPTVIGTGSNSFVSVQGWDENTSSYVEKVSGDALTPGTGFWVYVGDGPTTTNGMTLVNTGPLFQGTKSSAVTAAGTGTNQGLNLVANPFACPISWTKVYAFGGNSSAVLDNIYVWNADAGGGTGATTSYVSTTNTSSHSGTVGITDVIAGGQAFYVEQSGFINVLDFPESAKNFSITGNTSANPLLRTTSSISLQKFRLKIAGSYDYDETAFCVHSDATLQYDKGYDAKKFFQSPGYVGYPGPYTKYTTISSKDSQGKDYSINTIGPLAESVMIPILARVSVSGSYTISAKDFENFNTCVGLIDKLDNSYHDLRVNPYVCTINDTTSSPRFELVLCRDPYVDLVSVPEVENSGSILINQDQQGAYVKTVFTQGTKAVISAYNILGQKLMNDLTVEGTVTNTRLNLDVHNQIVIIKVATDKETSTKKLVVH